MRTAITTVGTTPLTNREYYQKTTCQSAAEFYYETVEATRDRLILAGDPDIEGRCIGMSEDEKDIWLESESGEILFCFPSDIVVDCYLISHPEMSSWDELEIEYHIISGDGTYIMRCIDRDAD